MTEPDRWCLVVPVKRLSVAKTRLVSVAGRHRTELALAFALDTVEAALGCDRVSAVVAVSDDPEAIKALTGLGAIVVADEPNAGLNPALIHGVAVARAAHPDGGVGALSADLPALRVVELAAALSEAAGHDVSFVSDAVGKGTTLLLARRGAAFEPQFGAGSRRLHAAAGALELTGDFPSLRRDVDTERDLAVAAALGLGPRSRAVVGRIAADEIR
ncbi:MAG: 2-phospho-L-lactate guanylyltransferase [Sporichthyaceae bacterium]